MTNVFKKPWFTGDFGNKIQDAIVEMLETLTPEHPFFSEHAQAVLFDMQEEDENHSLEEAFEFFKETAASMVSAAGGVLVSGQVSSHKICI